MQLATKGKREKASRLWRPLWGKDGTPVFGWPSPSAECVAVLLVPAVCCMDCVTAAGV